MAEIAMNVVNGVRPHKLEKASEIGFTDLLWEFTQRCWDGEIKLRPEVVEVEAELGKVAANWNRGMPPCAQKDGKATPIPQEPVSQPPLGLERIAAELQLRPNQDLIDRADAVSSSSYQYLHIKLMQALAAGRYRV